MCSLFFSSFSIKWIITGEDYGGEVGEYQEGEIKQEPGYDDQEYGDQYANGEGMVEGEQGEQYQNYQEEGLVDN